MTYKRVEKAKEINERKGATRSNRFAMIGEAEPASPRRRVSRPRAMLS